MFAEIVVNRPLYRRPPTGSEPLRDDASRRATLTYHLPERLRESAAVGHLVQVPLQDQQRRGGDPRPGGGTTTRPAGRDHPRRDRNPRSAAGGDTDPDRPGPLDRRKDSVAAQRGAAADAAARPGGADGGRRHAERSLTPPQVAAPQRPPLTPEESAALNLLHSRGGRLRLSLIVSRLRVEDPEAVIHSLADKGLVDARWTLVPPKPAPPRVQYVRLLADEAALMAALPRLGRRSKQADALLVLARRADAPLSLADLCRLAECGAGSVQALAKRGWVEITPRRSLVLALPGAASADLGGAARQREVLEALLQHGGPVPQEELLRETGSLPGSLCGARAEGAGAEGRRGAAGTAETAPAAGPGAGGGTTRRAASAGRARAAAGQRRSRLGGRHLCPDRRRSWPTLRPWPTAG